MGKPAKVPFSKADLHANRDRSWTDTAETIAVIGCGAGVALSLIFKQAAFAIVPPIFAIGFNIINRTHRIQSARIHAVAAVRQADHLRTDLNNLTTALHALPIGDRVLEIEDYLYRVNAALVQMQQRQEAIAAAAEEDREKIKEAFSIVRQGVYNLNDYTNATFEEIRSDLSQLRQIVAELPQTLPYAVTDGAGGSNGFGAGFGTGFGNGLGSLAGNAPAPMPGTAIVRHPPGSVMPVAPTTIDLTPVQYHIDRLDERVDLLEQQYQGTVQPQIQRLAYNVRQIRDNSPQKWIEQIDHRLEQVLPYQYQVSQNDRTDLLFKAIREANDRLIIVTPWLPNKPQLPRFLAVLAEALDQNLFVSIGWGDRLDIGKGANCTRPIVLKDGGWRYQPNYDPDGLYAALPELLRLRKRYKRLHLKLIGTREKLIVCDRSWALLGGQHFLCDIGGHGANDPGLFTTDKKIVAEISQRFNIDKVATPRPMLRAENV